MCAYYLKGDLVFSYAEFQNLARLQYEIINDYFKHFERFLKEKEERVAEASQCGEVIATIPVEGDFHALIDDMVEWGHANSAQVVYNTLFINSNSFLEWGLIEICRLAAVYIDDNFYDYKNGKGLEKAKNYLKEKLTVTLNTGGKEWQRFTLNQEVRNLIVHNGANIVVDHTKYVNDQPIYKNIKPVEKDFNKAFLITETGFIYIKDANYIRESHNWAIDFVQQTLDAVRVELIKRGFNWS